MSGTTQTISANTVMMFHRFQDAKGRKPEDVFRTMKRYAQRYFEPSVWRVGHRYDPMQSVMEYAFYAEGQR